MHIKKKKKGEMLMGNINKQGVIAGSLLSLYGTLVFGWWINGLNIQISLLSAVGFSLFVSIFSVWFCIPRKDVADFILASSIGSAMGISLLATKFFDNEMLSSFASVSERVEVNFAVFCEVFVFSFMMLMFLNMFIPLPFLGVRDRALKN